MNADRVLDAAGLLHRWGQEAQAVALTMWKHEISQPLGVCSACGRLPVRELPMFGGRCQVAVEQWERAHQAIRLLFSSGTPARPTVGRAPVPGDRARRSR
ncbi:MAG: hypothetical protein ACRDT6_26255 [Micromonosporaceae bacterium]